ncbi:signal recognition particle protein [Kangiella geojedonensis]|uniref:Signal recognition particle protein n=1 Tax=Kangiella geojedonensis TaxID=914150 RepID=A0A0F6RCY3_9GAMM|nr:signal recognition particle protein [Kangiella geojedonensis]AKE52441.1 signal recognition particle protein Srp54 [Kangiella geojedonensis]
MFDNLSDRLSGALKNLTGKGKITEDNVKETLREVRMALLEADVALPVVKDFIAAVKTRAVGTEVGKALDPGQAFIKVVNDELVKAMGAENDALDLNAKPPVVILLAGLQGAGKTTSAGKLSHLLINREKKSVMVASADVYRPAAIKQLETVAGEVGATFFPSSTEQKPVDIAKNAIEEARKQFMDVIIIDTAGRLAVDEAMMSEISELQQTVEPTETLFVVDSMTGQDAANTAKAFNDALDLTGVILTKADGDARGGAALSIRQITGKPIKFIGMGEKLDQLEPFHPERVASRILGMGDVLSLIEEVERKVDKTKAEKVAKKIMKGKGFDLQDFREQLLQMSNMGGMAGLMDKLPGMGQIPEAAKQKVMNDKSTGRMVAMINSMTPKERARPELIKGSRKKRIANGSGTQIQDVNRMLKQFNQMQKMMKKMKGKGGMMKMMRSMQGMTPPGGGGMGGMPPFGRK